MSLSCSHVLNLTPGRRLVDRPPKYRPGASSVERCEHAPRCQAILPADRASVPGRPPGCLIADARVRNNRHGRVGRGGREEQPRDARKSRHPQRRAGKIPGRLRGRRRKCVGRVRERRSDAAGRLELPFQVAHLQSQHTEGPRRSSRPHLPCGSSRRADLPPGISSTFL